MHLAEGRPGDEDEERVCEARSGQIGETTPSAAGGSASTGVDREGQEGSGGPRSRQEAARGPAGPLPGPSQHVQPLTPPHRTPLYYAQHAGRYQRQQLIRDYQADHDCRLVVMIGPIFAYSVHYFEELLFDASREQPLHLLLWSPGGDGEIAVRLVRSAQARCSELTVIVPDIAKSAATILALGADQILMGPASDLGPIDPQFEVGGEYDLVSAKDIIAAVERALDDIAARPDTYPMYSALLADVNALRVEQARSALARTDDLLMEALRSNPRRSPAEAGKLAKQLHVPLIEAPKDHAAIFGAEDARKAGLPAVTCDPSSGQWRQIWQLWMHYYALFPVQAYESDAASQLQRQQDDD